MSFYHFEHVLVWKQIWEIHYLQNLKISKEVIFSQSAFMCSKLTEETWEQGVKYVQS